MLNLKIFSVSKESQEKFQEMFYRKIVEYMIEPDSIRKLQLFYGFVEVENWKILINVELMEAFIMMIRSESVEDPFPSFEEIVENPELFAAENANIFKSVLEFVLFIEVDSLYSDQHFEEYDSDNPEKIYDQINEVNNSSEYKGAMKAYSFFTNNLGRQVFAKLFAEAISKFSQKYNIGFQDIENIIYHIQEDTFQRMMEAMKKAEREKE